MPSVRNIMTAERVTTVVTTVVTTLDHEGSRRMPHGPELPYYMCQQGPVVAANGHHCLETVPQCHWWG